MLARYYKEAILLFAAVLLAGAVMFRTSTSSKLSNETKVAEEMASKTEDIAIMEKLWKKNKAIPRKLEKIKKEFSSSKVKIFKVDKKKAHILLENINGTELNNVVGKYIASIAIQITEISIERSGKNYKMELQCKW